MDTTADGSVCINTEFLETKSEQCGYSPPRSYPSTYTQDICNIDNFTITLAYISPQSFSPPPSSPTLCYPSHLVPLTLTTMARTISHVHCSLTPLSCALVSTVKEVFKTLDVLGWYTTGAMPDMSHVPIHRQAGPIACIEQLWLPLLLQLLLFMVVVFVVVVVVAAGVDLLERSSTCNDLCYR